MALPAGVTEAAATPSVRRWRDLRARQMHGTANSPANRWSVAHRLRFFGHFPSPPRSSLFLRP